MLLAPANGASWFLTMEGFMVAAVWIQRYDNVPSCDVVALRDDEISIRCCNYDQAVKWARMECKSYRVADFTEKKS